jgi:4-hydroxy-3-methylbut-2-enyl diphosphate reductase
VYVRRAIVHNADVVARLAAAGARFVDDLDEVPSGGVVVFSAHGVPLAVREQAASRHLRVVDATCPLVAKVHREVRRSRGLGSDVILIGHAGHDEVIGTLGQAPGVNLVETEGDVPTLSVADPDRVACVTQTTLSQNELSPVLERLHQRFPAMALPVAGDICYATRNRQAAVAWLARNVDLVVVVGDPTSSNSRHLCETARANGTPAYLVASVADLDADWLEGATVVGVSAGASTPDNLVQAVVERLASDGAPVEDQVRCVERLSFGLPTEVAPLHDSHDRASPRRSHRRGRRRPRITASSSVSPLRSRESR